MHTLLKTAIQLSDIWTLNEYPIYIGSLIADCTLNAFLFSNGIILIYELGCCICISNYISALFYSREILKANFFIIRINDFSKQNILSSSLV